MTSRAPELSNAAGSGLAQPAPASHPMANAQMPAAYRCKLGGFECTVVSDGPLRLGTFSTELFRGLAQERIDEFVAANFLDKNNFVIDQKEVPDERYDAERCDGNSGVADRKLAWGIQ